MSLRYRKSDIAPMVVDTLPPRIDPSVPNGRESLIHLGIFVARHRVLKVLREFRRHEHYDPYEQVQVLWRNRRCRHLLRLRRICTLKLDLSLSPNSMDSQQNWRKDERRGLLVSRGRERQLLFGYISPKIDTVHITKARKKRVFNSRCALIVCNVPGM